MIVAELEILHTRPIAPTRRVALGERRLPVDPAPGFGGLLLGGVVAAHIGALHPDLHGELHRLIRDLEEDRRIVQPRLRHRFQTDTVGLTSSRHRLHGRGDALEFDFADKGRPESQILGAVYAAGALPRPARPPVMDVLRRAIRWSGGEPGPALVAHLAGSHAARSLPGAAYADPHRWALGVLGFDEVIACRDEVVARFRQLVRAAHPDHGGDAEAAAQRILDLSEARRILLRG